MFAPLGTAEILLWVPNFLAARGANAVRLILPELDLALAKRAGRREDIFRLPIAHVLTGATIFWHGGAGKGVGYTSCTVTWVTQLHELHGEP